VLLTREKEINNLSPLFPSSDIIENTKGAVFNLKRSSRHYNPYRKIRIGDFLSLTNQEFEKCINSSLE